MSSTPSPKGCLTASECARYPRAQVAINRRATPSQPTAGVADIATETPALRSTVVRLGVVLCVVACAGMVVLKLDDSLGVLDQGADRSASTTYSERTYPTSRWVAGDANVLEDARLWMPENATYRVVLGPRQAMLGYSDWAPYFLHFALLPRRQSTSRDAPWVFCYGCDAASVARLEVLSDGDGEVVFGRTNR